MEAGAADNADETEDNDQEGKRGKTQQFFNILQTFFLVCLLVFLLRCSREISLADLIRRLMKSLRSEGQSTQQVPSCLMGKTCISLFVNSVKNIHIGLEKLESTEYNFCNQYK